MNKRVLAARWLAVGVDVVQWVALPFFAPGFVSPLNQALDVVTGVAMVWMLGWHLAFLPTFLAELFPVVDLFPTWTAAVFFVTRKAGQSPVRGPQT